MLQQPTNTAAINTLRNYQEMISDEEDEGINSKMYRINKNSKKFRKQ